MIRPLPSHLTTLLATKITTLPRHLETDNATSGQRPSSSRTPTYKGIPLTIADVVNKSPELRSFSAKKCGRTRAHILCTTCQEYEEMAKKSSKNGTVAIASGVRTDCSDRLERVIDHVTSEPHIAATNKKKMDEAWEECTTSHPWLRALTAYNKTVFAMLLRMAVTYTTTVQSKRSPPDRGRCDLWLVWRRTICWPLCDKMAQMWNLFHSRPRLATYTTGTQTTISRCWMSYTN